MTNRWTHLCGYEQSNTSLLYLKELKVQDSQQKGIQYFGMILKSPKIHASDIQVLGSCLYQWHYGIDASKALNVVDAESGGILTKHFMHAPKIVVLTYVSCM